MKACISCYWWNGSILHPHCGMYERDIRLDPEWNLIPVNKCLHAEEQKAMTARLPQETTCD